MRVILKMMRLWTQKELQISLKLIKLLFYKWLEVKCLTRREGRLRPSDKQIIRSGKLAKSSINQRLKVWNYLKAPEECGTKNNCGRPKKLMICQQRLLVRKTSTGKFSENQIRNGLDLRICKSTVLSYLRSSGILLNEKRLKIPALKNHKLERVEWTKTMLQRLHGQYYFFWWSSVLLAWPQVRKRNIFCPKSWSRISDDLGRNFLWRINWIGLSGWEAVFSRLHQSIRRSPPAFWEAYYEKNFIFQQDNASIILPSWGRHFSRAEILKLWVGQPVSQT